MRLIFTANSSILSRMIKWATGEPASHFACILYEDTIPIVFQSNLLGLDFSSGKMFSAHQTIVHSIDYPMEQAEEDIVFDSIVQRMVGEKYDFGALAYFAYRCLLWKLFSMPFPETNKWASTDKSLCVELAYGMPDHIVPQSIKSLDLGIKTPLKLYELIKQWKDSNA